MWNCGKLCPCTIHQELPKTEKTPEIAKCLIPASRKKINSISAESNTVLCKFMILLIIQKLFLRSAKVKKRFMKIFSFVMVIYSRRIYCLHVWIVCALPSNKDFILTFKFQVIVKLIQNVYSLTFSICCGKTMYILQR